MSIFRGTVKKKNRVTLASTKVRIFNTNRIGELKAVSTDSAFNYTRNFLDRRESDYEYTIDETKAVVDAFFSGDDNKIVLSALQKKVGAKTIAYVETITLKLSDIAYGWADPDDATLTWLECYPNAFQKVIYQVDAPIGFFDGTSNFLSFDFLALTPDVIGVIDYTAGAKAVALTVPFGTVVTALVATFTTNTGAIVKVSTNVQTSGSTQNNFSSPVVYLITGVDGRVETYTVTVTVTPNTTTTTAAATTTTAAATTTTAAATTTTAAGTTTTTTP